MADCAHHFINYYILNKSPIMLISSHVVTSSLWNCKLKIDIFYDIKVFFSELNGSNFTLLKWIIESNSTWEDAFYQIEWVKIYSNWII